LGGRRIADRKLNGDPRVYLTDVITKILQKAPQQSRSNTGMRTTLRSAAAALHVEPKSPALDER
jgi:hypothetical protein